jgi:hypothetical protein
MPLGTIVPTAVRFMALALLIVPVKFALTLAPPAQVAETVPASEVADCSVINHFRSAQLLIGRPAIEEEPHSPEKAEAGVLPEPLVLDEDDDPDGVVLPAAAVLPPGAVGVRSLDVFSNAQLVTSVEASTTVITEAFFMIVPTVVSAHTGEVCTSDDLLENLERPGRCRKYSKEGAPASGVKSDR